MHICGSLCHQTIGIQEQTNEIDKELFDDLEFEPIVLTPPPAPPSLPPPQTKEEFKRDWGFDGDIPLGKRVAGSLFSNEE